MNDVKRLCAKCGKEIVRKPNDDDVRWARRKFCSQDCARSRHHKRAGR